MIQAEWMRQTKCPESEQYFELLETEEGCAELANWFQNKINEELDAEALAQMEV